MTRKPIVLIGGARPNFMKIAPLYHELLRRHMPVVLINAGQHRDPALSSDFFAEFRMRADHTLHLEAASPDAFIDVATEKLVAALRELEPGAVVVFGDVNATLAGARAAAKLGLPLAHVEAGLRSGNVRMREEHNRIEVDLLASLLFVTEESGTNNLQRERVKGDVHEVGNIMIDTAALFFPKLRAPQSGDFYFATVHRAENVDDRTVFGEIIDALDAVAKDAPIYLPLHPRTKKQAEAFGLMDRLAGTVRLLPPLSYTDALSYERFAKLVLTDSGGIQEETSFLGTPCITLRAETERPVTVEKGTNVIGGVTKVSILKAYREYKEKGFPRKQTHIPLWDGKAAERITDVLEKAL